MNKLAKRFGLDVPNLGSLVARHGQNEFVAGIPGETVDAAAVRWRADLVEFVACFAIEYDQLAVRATRCKFLTIRRVSHNVDESKHID